MVFSDLVSGGQAPSGDRGMEDHAHHNGTSEPVNFIVGDEGDSLENGLENNIVTEEEKRENTDAFPSENNTPPPNASYKDLFGLAERRKRLR